MASPRDHGSEHATEVPGGAAGEASTGWTPVERFPQAAPHPPRDIEGARLSSLNAQWAAGSSDNEGEDTEHVQPLAFSRAAEEPGSAATAGETGHPFGASPAVSGATGPGAVLRDAAQPSDMLQAGHGEAPSADGVCHLYEACARARPARPSSSSSRAKPSVPTRRTEAEEMELLPKAQRILGKYLALQRAGTISSEQQAHLLWMTEFLSGITAERAEVLLRREASSP